MGNWFPVGKVGAQTTYADKAACELAEGQSCYDITGKDLRWHEISGDALVEIPGKKDQVENLDALLDKQNSKYNISGADLLRKIHGLYDHIEQMLLARTCHFPRGAGRHTTVGGATTENISVPGVKEGMMCLIQLHTEGAAPVSIKYARCEADNLLVEFSADPSNDHKIEYYIYI